MSLTWQTISPAQKKMARKFSDASNFTVSQAAKYLNECFQLAKGEITEEQFTELTGNAPHTLRF